MHWLYWITSRSRERHCTGLALLSILTYIWICTVQVCMYIHLMGHNILRKLDIFLEYVWMVTCKCFFLSVDRPKINAAVRKHIREIFQRVIASVIKFALNYILITWIYFSTYHLQIIVKLVPDAYRVYNIRLQRN